MTFFVVFIACFAVGALAFVPAHFVLGVATIFYLVVMSFCCIIWNPNSFPDQEEAWYNSFDLKTGRKVGRGSRLLR